MTSKLKCACEKVMKKHFAFQYEFIFRSLFYTALDHTTKFTLLFQVLVGSLETNSNTGQLLLVDKTGSIQCCVTKTKDTDETDLKWSDVYNNNKSTFLQPSVLEQIVRVNKFLLVSEEFMHCNDNDGTGRHKSDALVSKDGCSSSANQRTTHDSKKDWSHIYLVFDVKDIVTVCPKINLEAQKPVKRTAFSAGLKQPDDKTVAAGTSSSKHKQKKVVFLVKDKSWPQQSTTNSECCSFYVDVEFFDVDTKVPCVGVSAQRKSRSAALWFDKEAVKWFPVLFPGCWYEFSLDPTCTVSIVHFFFHHFSLLTYRKGTSKLEREHKKLDRRVE